MIYEVMCRLEITNLLFITQIKIPRHNPVILPSFQFSLVVNGWLNVFVPRYLVQRQYGTVVRPFDHQVVGEYFFVISECRLVAFSGSERYQAVEYRFSRFVFADKHHERKLLDAYTAFFITTRFRDGITANHFFPQFVVQVARPCLVTLLGGSPVQFRHQLGGRRHIIRQAAPRSVPFPSIQL